MIAWENQGLKYSYPLRIECEWRQEVQAGERQNLCLSWDPLFARSLLEDMTLSLSSTFRSARIMTLYTFVR